MIALITQDVGKAWRHLPTDLEIRLCPADPDAIAAALDDDVEIFVGEVMPAGGDRGAGLRWIQLLSAGTDQLIGHPLMRRDLLVSSASGANAIPIAEFIVGRMLYHAKSMAAYAHLQRSHIWPDTQELLRLARPSLRDMRALLVGYGGIGRETAHLLSAFGLRIEAVASKARRHAYHGYMPYKGTGDPEAQIPERIIASADLRAALPDADVVVLSVPLLPATEHMIGREDLACMKASAILINVARGPIVDTTALLEALDSGRPAHAYLDVFDEEPLPAGSPLWDHPRVSITPHVAAAMPDYQHKLGQLFLENLERFRKGQPLINQLDRRTFIEAGEGQ